MDERSPDNRSRDATKRNAETVSLTQLRDAVERGVISAEQLAAILGYPYLPPQGSALTAQPGDAISGPPTVTPVEMKRGLNVVMIAYYLGTATVVFAFGWFLVDRWKVLGAGGILAVVLVYALAFLMTARTLERLGFRTAAALLVLATVMLAPLAMWCVLKLAGLWYEPIPSAMPASWPHDDVLESLRWVPIELSMALAALVAIRHARFGLLALPVAAVVPCIAVQLLPVMIDPDIARELAGWVTLTTAAVLIATAYWIDIRKFGAEDYAFWVYLVGLSTFFGAWVSVWQPLERERHLLPAMAIGLFILSLYLRRTIFAVFGAIGFVWYLGYLAFDVFRQTLSFPVVLATFGVSVIVLTVAAQRRYPALARQVQATRGDRRNVPHDRLVFGGAIMTMLTLLAVHAPEARARMQDRWMNMRTQTLRMKASRHDSRRLPTKAGETTTKPKP